MPIGLNFTSNVNNNINNNIHNLPLLGVTQEASCIGYMHEEKS